MSTVEEEIDKHDRAPSPDIPDPAEAESEAKGLDLPPPPSLAEIQSRKRPRIAVKSTNNEGDGEGGPRKKPRTKSLFGLMLSTLQTAKSEEEKASQNSKVQNRKELDKRLAEKRMQETSRVQKVEEARKERSSAGRKEEELGVRDSVYKHRKKILPMLANFLSTADNIPQNEQDVDNNEEDMDDDKVLALPPRSHPPPLYYLPAKLLPVQEKWIERRQSKVQAALEREAALFREEKAKGIEEIQRLRKQAAEELAANADASPSKSDDKMDTDVLEKAKHSEKTKDKDVDMVDDTEKKGDGEDDAIEY